MRTQQIHKAVRTIFKSDEDLMAIFSARLSNTRLPEHFPRPYVIIKVKCLDTELYTGGSIVDYNMYLGIYTTEGTMASEIAEKLNTIFNLVSNLLVDDARVLACFPTTETDGIQPETDLGKDTLLNEFNWKIKLFEPTG